jgi:hypothetical protein
MRGDSQAEVPVAELIAKCPQMCWHKKCDALAVSPGGDHMHDTYRVSERRACRVARILVSSYRYESEQEPAQHSLSLDFVPGRLAGWRTLPGLDDHECVHTRKTLPLEVGQEPKEKTWFPPRMQIGRKEERQSYLLPLRSGGFGNAPDCEAPRGEAVHRSLEARIQWELPSPTFGRTNVK